MYATRALSSCRRSSSSLEEFPNEGPFSGYLVITDEEAEAENTTCCGGFPTTSVKKLPFPQDRVLNFWPASEESPDTKLWFVPALGRPLSSNFYYVIIAEGKHQGKSCVCSRDVDVEPTCFGTSVRDARPSDFDPTDAYKVFRIHRHHSRGFFAESVAPDGFPAKKLRRKSWEVRTSSSLQPHLEEALGLDTALRARLPDFTFPISGNRPAPAPVVVGKWYCPCVFVREEGVEAKQQMKKSMFYKMTLEQKWEELHACENEGSNEGDNKASVNVAFPEEEASVFGRRAAKDDGETGDGFAWFRVETHGEASRGIGLGLSSAIAEKMKWVMREGGWVGDGEGSGREVRVERVEEFRGEQKWKRFGCYVLVESFVLTRLDGSLVLKCDFRHAHRIQCKWE